MAVISLGCTNNSKKVESVLSQVAQSGEECVLGDVRYSIPSDIYARKQIRHLF